ncbi:PucR family transcriptional regulator [Nocardia pseudovaccinii]|uniref:PucR family transcriptional regulator n=1 Tax=Nocardia pseudovaccinii TaxID=189540 RepID=UPI0007A45213|nr:helix-turn-helix domain-containing protein [Nocardia pseudovaccinii]
MPELAKENAALRRLAAAYQHLSSLATQDTGIEAVTEQLAERVATAVAVVDEKLEVLAAAASGRSEFEAAKLVLDRISHPRLAQVLGVAGPARRALRIPSLAGGAPIIVAPVPVGETTAGYVLTLDDSDESDGEDLRLLLTEHAATICGVILGRERVVAAAATQARYDLIEGLVSGKGSDADEVRRWAAHLGYDEQLPHRVLSVVLCGNSEDLLRRVPAAVERFFTMQVPEAITALRGREVVVMLPEPDLDKPRAMRLANACLDRVRGTFDGSTVTVGIGGVCRSAVEIARSYDDARRAVKIVGRMGRAGTAVAMEDLGIHRLLLQVADSGQLRDFAREVFGGLIAQAKGNATEYLSTLASYFRQNNSLQRVARELHVHPNTVSYRVRRVEELTRLDFRNYRDRLVAQVALEIVDVMGESL